MNRFKRSMIANAQFLRGRRTVACVVDDALVGHFMGKRLHDFLFDRAEFTMMPIADFIRRREDIRAAALASYNVGPKAWEHLERMVDGHLAGVPRSALPERYRWLHRRRDLCRRFGYDRFDRWCRENARLRAFEAIGIAPDF